MEDRRERDPLAPTVGDVSHALAKAALGAIPFIGGPAAELFGLILADPLSKRRDAWMREIADRVRDLEAEVPGLSAERLAQDPSFVSVIATASQIAMRTHQEEKLGALRNAVINAARGIVPDDSLRTMMLNLVDRFTPLHLAVLQVMRDPRAVPGVASRYEHAMTSSIDDLLKFTVQHLPTNGVVDLVWRDLVDSCLVGGSNIRTMMSGSGALAKRTTELGDEFLQFIASPERAGP